MTKILALFFSLLAGAAFAQGPGPGPPPQPWLVNGNQISYPGCVLVPVSVVGGCQGAGTISSRFFAVPSTTAGAGLNIIPGVAPTSPINGALWTTSSGLFVHVAGSTIELTGAGPGSFTATLPVVVSFPSAGVVNYALQNNSSLVVDGSNNLGINYAHPGTWTGTQTFAAITFQGYTAGLPLVGNGSSSNVGSGTVSGNTTEFVTTTGAQIANQCVKIDSNGNHVPSGANCGSSNNSPSVDDFGSASFTGVISGTNLTTSAVTGTINIGAHVTGSGVAACTIVVSQTSGTTGGAGVYVVSVSQTVGSEAMTQGVVGGTTTSLTLCSTPQNAQLVSVSFDGVLQAHTTYSLSTATLNFDAAIPVNTKIVEAQYSSANTLAGVAGLTVGGTTLTGAVTLDGYSGINLTVAGQHIQISTNLVVDASKPPYNAVPDGSTNNRTAINAAFAAGAIVFLPVVPGTANTYCVSGGSNFASSGQILLGGGPLVTLSACGDNTAPTVTMGSNNAGTGNFAQDRIANLNVVGPGYGANYAAVLASYCVNCTITDSQISGGDFPFEFINSSDMKVDNTPISYGYATAEIYNAGGALYLSRVKKDQGYPGGTPTNSYPWSPRAQNTNYAYGNVVSCSGYYLQDVTAGTNESGSSSSCPTLASYGLPITDGAVTWNLLAPTTYYCLQVDLGAVQAHDTDGDCTGPFLYGIFIGNTTAGGASPQGTFIDHDTFGVLTNGVQAQAGAGLNVNNSQFATCLANTTCAAVGLSNYVSGSCGANTAWCGDADVSGNLMYTMGYGIFDGSGTNNNASNNRIYGMSQSALYAAAGVGTFNWSANSIGGSNSWGNNGGSATVAAGTGDYFTIIGNNCHYVLPSPGNVPLVNNSSASPSHWQIANNPGC